MGTERGMRHRAFEEDSEVAGVGADIEQAYAQLALVGGKRGLRGGNATQAPPR